MKYANYGIILASLLAGLTAQAESEVYKGIIDLSQCSKMALSPLQGKYNVEMVLSYETNTLSTTFAVKESSRTYRSEDGEDLQINICNGRLTFATGRMKFQLRDTNDHLITGFDAGIPIVASYTVNKDKAESCGSRSIIPTGDRLDIDFDRKDATSAFKIGKFTVIPRFYSLKREGRAVYQPEKNQWALSKLTDTPNWLRLSYDILREGAKPLHCDGTAMVELFRE